jgi:hypothetical protein
MCKLTTAMAFAIIAALSMGTAMAQNPHFLSANASLDGSNLKCTFKIAGLGSNETITVACTADASVLYECINKGGKNPSAGNKTTVSGPVSGSGDFTSGQNGQVSGSVTASAPSAGDFTCPGGQTLTVCAVTYSNITLSGGGDSADLGSVNFTSTARGCEF